MSIRRLLLPSLCSALFVGGATASNAIAQPAPPPIIDVHWLTASLSVGGGANGTVVPSVEEARDALVSERFAKARYFVPQRGAVFTPE